MHFGCKPLSHCSKADGGQPSAGLQLICMLFRWDLNELKSSFKVRKFSVPALGKSPEEPQLSNAFPFISIPEESHG